MNDVCVFYNAQLIIVMLTFVDLSQDLVYNIIIIFKI